MPASPPCRKYRHSIHVGITDWWGMGDYAGLGSHGVNYAYGPRYIGWQNANGGMVSGVGGRSVAKAFEKCAKDAGSLAGSGWDHALGHPGGSVAYPGGSPWYNTAEWTLNFWYRNSVVLWSDFCQYYLYSTIEPPFLSHAPYSSGTTYHFGDEISWTGSGGGGGALPTPPYIATAQTTFFSDGSQPPGSVADQTFGLWSGPPENPCEQPYGPWGIKTSGGVMGDHLGGVPNPVGWAITANGRSLNFFTENGVGGSWSMGLGYVGSYNDGPELGDGIPHMITITGDGTDFKAYNNGVLVGAHSGYPIWTSNAGLGFGFTDFTAVLSGNYNNMLGLLDETIMWNRPLGEKEVYALYNCPPCEDGGIFEISMRPEEADTSMTN